MGELLIRECVLFHRCVRKDGTEEYIQLSVPKVLRKELLHEMHSGLLSGHLGRKKTKWRILQLYYWWGLDVDVNTLISKESRDYCLLSQT